MSDLPPPLDGYHRDAPADARSDDTHQIVEVSNKVVALALLLLALGLSALIPFIIMLWKAAL